MASAVELLAQHIASEEHASRTYRLLQSWCGLNGFSGCEAYFRAESKDELEHMWKFQDYVDDIWLDTKTPPVQSQPQISADPEALADCFLAALDLERVVLGQLNEIGKQAVLDNNFDALRFIQEFTEIGVNSIRELTGFVQQLELAGSDPAALLEFNENVGESVQH